MTAERNWVTELLTPQTEAGREADREERWSWARLDPAVKAKFVARMAELLPVLDPETEWANMPVPYRRELAWHLSRTSEQLRSAWEDECHRLAAEADEETMAIFRELVAIKAVMGE